MLKILKFNESVFLQNSNSLNNSEATKEAKKNVTTSKIMSQLSKREREWLKIIVIYARLMDLTDAAHRNVYKQ